MPLSTERGSTSRRAMLSFPSDRTREEEEFIRKLLAGTPLREMEHHAALAVKAAIKRRMDGSSPEETKGKVEQQSVHRKPLGQSSELEPTEKKSPEKILADFRKKKNILKHSLPKQEPKEQSLLQQTSFSESITQVSRPDLLLSTRIQSVTKQGPKERDVAHRSSANENVNPVDQKPRPPPPRKPSFIERPLTHRDPFQPGLMQGQDPGATQTANYSRFLPTPTHSDADEDDSDRSRC